MKKAIVRKDLNGLSRIGLDNYAKAVSGMPNAHWQVLQNVAKHDSMPLMNIGDMIEFLAEHDFRETWMIFHRSETLCDDLWEAVKEVLNNG